MRQSNRLISNVLVTYVRMALTIGIGLTTIRLLVGTLGLVDYGLLSVLGGGLSLITLLSQALSDAAQRHMAYEIGRGDETALRQVFTTSVVVYLGLGFVMASLGLGLRPVFLGLNIPVDRLAAAGWVYDLTLLNLSLSVLATPFLAVFLARQAMIQDAVFAFFTSVAGLVAVLLTPYVHTDRLIGYAILITSVRLLFMFLQIARGLLLFPETRLRLRYFDRKRLRELTGFAGWSFVISFAWQLRVQGAQIILNIFFGPVVNAGYDVAMKLAGYTMTLSRVVSTASRPVMASAVGAEKPQQIVKLARSISKINLLVCSTLAIPLIVAPQAVLMLWIGNVPPYADSFIPIVIGWNLISIIVSGQNIAVVANGRLTEFALSYLCVTAIGLIVPIVLFSLFSVTPAYLPVASLGAQLVLIPVNLAIAKRMLGFAYSDWYKKVLRPVSPTLLLAAMACAATAYFLGSPLLTLLLCLAVTAVSLLIAAWCIVLDYDEKVLLQRFIGRIKAKLN